MNKIKLNYLETHLTHHCNLNCAHCSHYAPLAEPWFKDYDEFVNELQQIAKITSCKLIEFHLLGGEPLLHPRILDFCYISRKILPDTYIELVTNGILLLKQDNDFFNKLNEWNIAIYWSDYGLNPKIEELICKKIKTYRVGRRPSLINPSINLHGDGNNQINFNRCKDTFHGTAYTLRNGKIYHCPTGAYFDLFLKYYNITLKDFKLENNGINIFTSNLEDIENYLNYPDNFCKYCDMEKKLIRHKFSISEKSISEWTN